MGKVEEEAAPSSSDVVSGSSEPNAERRCGNRRVLGFRCVLALLFSVAVFLSAVFWLPPFLQKGDQRDLDPEPLLRDHDIVASFKVKKPVPWLQDNILKLVDDIFDEINFPTIKVVIISLKPVSGPNITEVVFAVDPEPEYSEVSVTTLSLIRASFEALVVQQSYLRLTTSLFGNPLFFEVLKFPEGFTVIPPQNVFLLQKAQIQFNFSLHFSIYQIQENFGELTRQLMLGLHLAAYENLYISLTNLKGSTVDPPTIVQSSVLLAIGNTPSTTRLKQLAQTIAGSHARNLGLNNTEFGRVKQVSLSSILRHSLHGNEGGGPPAPTPAPHAHHHQHHHQHHHHHHHHHRHDHRAMPPASAPDTGSPGPPKSSPSPGPTKPYYGRPPDCHNGGRGKRRIQPHQVPTVPPMISPRPSAVSPHPRARPPSSFLPPSPASSPSPNAAFSSNHPPSMSEGGSEPPDSRPVAQPLTSSSPSRILGAHRWLFPLLFTLGFHL